MKGRWSDDNDMKRDGNCNNKEDNCKYIDFSSLCVVKCKLPTGKGFEIYMSDICYRIKKGPHNT